jgi:hypothetical protein
MLSKVFSLKEEEYRKKSKGGGGGILCPGLTPVLNWCCL